MRMFKKGKNVKLKQFLKFYVGFWTRVNYDYLASVAKDSMELDQFGSGIEQLINIYSKYQRKLLSSDDTRWKRYWEAAYCHPYSFYQATE